MEWKLSELSVDGKGHYGIGAPAIPYDKNKPTYLRITDIKYIKNADKLGEWIKNYVKVSESE